MMVLHKICLALAPVVLASPVLAQEPPPIRTTQIIPAPAPAARQKMPTEPTGSETIAYDTVGKWRVRIDTTLNIGCYAYTAFEDGTFLRLSTDPGDKQVYFMLSNWQWRSLKEGEDYDLKIRIGTNEPWYGTASAIIMGPQRLLAIPVDGEFLKEIAESWTMGVWYDDRQLAFLRLDDSEKALASILECDTYVRSVIDDPFSE